VLSNYFCLQNSLNHAQFAQHLADRIYHDKLGGKIPVLMVAVNEDGLTHTYVAGTSDSYEM